MRLATIIACLALLPVVAIAQLTIFEEIRQSKVQAIQERLDGGWDPNTPIEFHGGFINPLKAAIFDREERIGLLLLKNGGHFEDTDLTIHTVSSEGMHKLLAAILNLNQAAWNPGDSGLLAASSNGYYEVVRTLLEFAEDRGAFSDVQLELALGVSLITGHADIARLLISHGANTQYQEAIFASVRGGSPGMVRYVISQGADPRTTLPKELRAPQRTPLGYALDRLKNGNANDQWHAALIVRELIDHGAMEPGINPDGFIRTIDRELGEKDNNAAFLVSAARLGLLNEVEKMIEILGVGRLQVLETGIAAALEMNNDDIARLVLKTIGSRISDRVTHEVVRYGSPGLVRTAFKNGADPNAMLTGKSLAMTWYERMQSPSTQTDGSRVLHELAIAGVDVCLMIEYKDQLDVVSLLFLKDSATDCWEQ